MRNWSKRAELSSRGSASTPTVPHATALERALTGDTIFTEVVAIVGHPTPRPCGADTCLRSPRVHDRRRGTPRVLRDSRYGFISAELLRETRTLPHAGP